MVKNLFLTKAKIGAIEILRKYNEENISSGHAFLTADIRKWIPARHRQAFPAADVRSSV